MASAMRLDEAIEAFIASRKAQGIRSGIANEKSALINLMAVVGNLYPKSLGPEHVDKWLAANPHWQASTRKANINRLSVFQAWCRDRKLMPRGEDILRGRRRMKVPKKRRQRIAGDQFAEILDRAKTPRDRVVVAIGLFLLVRVSEMINIRWKDVHLDEGFVSIYRLKTTEPDELPIGPDLHDELVRWRRELCLRVETVAPDPDWFVVCQMEPPSTRDAHGYFTREGEVTVLKPWAQLRCPRVRIKKIMAQIGVDEPGSGMHTLRRSGAQALLESMIGDGEGKDQALMVVSSMLGHASVTTTQIYLDYQANRATRDRLVRSRRMITPETAIGRVVELRPRG
jgi:integrase